MRRSAFNASRTLPDRVRPHASRRSPSVPGSETRPTRPRAHALPQCASRAHPFRPRPRARSRLPSPSSCGSEPTISGRSHEGGETAPFVTVAKHDRAPVVLLVALAHPTHAVRVVPVVARVAVGEQLAGADEVGELRDRWLRVLPAAAVQVTPEHASAGREQSRCLTRSAHRTGSHPRGGGSSRTRVV
jgi:hypothetical protein